MRGSVSIAFQTDKPLSAYGPLAKTVEDYGFAGVSVYNDMLYQQAWLPLLEIARHSTRVRIGPAAVNPFTCHPINIAGNIALLDEASHGRAYLGLARGGWLDFVGLHPQRPITALREAFGCIRHLLSRSTQPYRGEVFSLAGGAALRWKIHRPELPFLLGTWGQKTLAACIEDIAEVKLGGTTNPAAVSQMRVAIVESAVQAVSTRVWVVPEHRTRGPTKPRRCLKPVPDGSSLVLPMVSQPRRAYAYWASGCYRRCESMLMKAERLSGLFACARRAVLAMRTRASQNGAEAITPADVEREIRTARRERKQRVRRV